MSVSTFPPLPAKPIQLDTDTWAPIVERIAVAESAVVNLQLANAALKRAADSALTGMWNVGLLSVCLMVVVGVSLFVVGAWWQRARTRERATANRA